MIRRCKGQFCALLAALIWAIAALSGPSPAAAEAARELLRVEMAASPAELVAPGDVTLHFSIENGSGADAQDVYLSSADGLVSEPLGLIAAGDSQSFTRTHSVSAAELEAGEIRYIISHDDPQSPANKVNYAVRAPIHQSDIQPRAEFTRQFSSRSAGAGSALTITYRVRNSGNVALLDLRVQDELGDYVGRVERLNAGESRTLVSRATVTESAASVASLSYRAEGAGDELFVETLEDVTISLAQPEIEASFSAACAPFSRDAADVFLRLTNRGNCDYSDITIEDALYGGVIAAGLSLPANGAPIEFGKTCALRGDGGFRWRVTGVSAAGERFELVTDTVSLEAPPSGDPAALTISAEALTPRIRRAGEVTVRVQISNPGGADVRGVLLSEDALGPLREFAVLPAGATIVRDVSLRVDSDSAYNFSIRYPGAGGEAMRASAPAEVVIAPDGVLPEGAQPRLFEFSGNSIKIGGSSTFAVLLIAGCALLIALVAALLILNHRAKLARRVRIAAEKQRRKEEMGKTARFTPVRAKKKARKGRK